MSVTPQWYLLLFSGTLLVYWSDHLMDVKMHAFVKINGRHRIIHQYRRAIITAIATLITSCAFIALYFLSFRELLAGTLIGAFICAYLLFHRMLPQSIFTLKEIQIGLLYTTAVFFPIFMNSSGDLPQIIGFTFLPVLLCVMQNLISLSILDAEDDQIAGIRNMSSMFGERMKIIHRTLWIFSLCWMCFIWINGSTDHTFILYLTGLCTLQFLLPFIGLKTGKDVVRFVGEMGFVLTMNY